MITRIWHGATPAGKSDEYLNLMRTIAIPDYRSTPGNKGAYVLRRIEGDTAHFLMITFWESEEAIRDFAGDDIKVAKYYDFDKNCLLELEPCSSAPRITRCTTGNQRRFQSGRKSVDCARICKLREVVRTDELKPLEDRAALVEVWWLSPGPFRTAVRLPLGNSARPPFGCRRSETYRNPRGFFLRPQFP